MLPPQNLGSTDSYRLLISTSFFYSQVVGFDLKEI